MHRRVIYQALAWVPIAAGSANLAFATTSAQINNKTVVYEDSTTYVQTPVAAETITTDKWYQPLATPTRRKVDVVNRQNLAINFPVTPTITTDMWWRQLDLPVRRKTVTGEEGALFGAPYQPPAVETITIDKWYAALPGPTWLPRSFYAQQAFGYGNYTPAAVGLPGDATLSFGTDTSQVFSRTIVYEPDAYTPFTPAAAAETVTIDKWWRQLDTPVRLRIALNPGAYSVAPPKPEANDQIAWFRQLELPTRRKLIVEGLHSAAPPKPEANDAIGWYAPLGEPQRLKRLQAGIHQFEARGAFPQVPWGWYAKLDEPTRLKKTPTTQIGLTFVAAAPGAGVAYNWFQQLDEPLRIKRTPKTDFTWSTFTPAPTEVVTIDKWWRELVVPTRRTRPVPQQMGYTFVAAAPGAGTAYNWFVQLDTPRREHRRVAYQQVTSDFPQFVNLGTSTLAATTTSAMVIRRAFLYEPIAFNYYTPPAVAFPGDATLSFGTDSAQVFTRTIIYEDSAYSPYVVPPPDIATALNWFLPLDEPIRPRKSISAAQQWALTRPSQLLVPTSFLPLHVPLRQPAKLNYSAGFSYSNFTPAPPMSSWFRELVLPTRRARPVPFQLSYTFVAAPGRGVAYNWFTALDMPTRRDHRRVAVQQGGTTGISGLTFPVIYQQTVVIEVTVEFGRMLQFSCKAEAQDAAVEQSETVDAWSVQAETGDAAVDETEQSDPWSVQDETDDASEEEDPNPTSGCT